MQISLSRRSKCYLYLLNLQLVFLKSWLDAQQFSVNHIPSIFEPWLISHVNCDLWDIFNQYKVSLVKKSFSLYSKKPCRGFVNHNGAPKILL